MKLVKRYYAILAKNVEGASVDMIRKNFIKLFGATSSHEVTLKTMEVREWGFVLRALMRYGYTSERVALTISFTKDDDGWLRPIACSGSYMALRKKLKGAELYSAKPG